MKNLDGFWTNVIDKLDIKKLLPSLFIVLAMMLVPKINYLSFLMPLDSREKWIMFVFAITSTYIALSVLTFLCKKVYDYYKNKPKKLCYMMYKYGKYINIFYSDELKEYSSTAFNLSKYGVSEDSISRLYDNKIIEIADLNYDKYHLTKKARKKLNRMRKVFTFIENKVNKKNK